MKFKNAIKPLLKDLIITKEEEINLEERNSELMKVYWQLQFGSHEVQLPLNDFCKTLLKASELLSVSLSIKTELEEIVSKISAINDERWDNQDKISFSQGAKKILSKIDEKSYSNSYLSYDIFYIKNNKVTEEALKYKEFCFYMNSERKLIKK